MIYTVILRNPTAVDQPDNPVDEFTDPLPWQVTVISASATTGVVLIVNTDKVTWNGVVPAMSSVIPTIKAIIQSDTEGQPVSNQGTILSGVPGHETFGLTDDPTNPAPPFQPTTFVADNPPLAKLVAIKSVSALGPYQPGGSITYTIVIANSGNAAQAGNTTQAELVDVLPAELELLGASSPANTWYPIQRPER